MDLETTHSGATPAGMPATNLVYVFQLVNNLANHWLGTFHLHLVVARLSFCSVPCDLGTVPVGVRTEETMM